MRQPSIFISHGAPTIVLEESLARNAISDLAQTVRKPDAILAFSAHYETETVEIVEDPAPGSMYDFGRFDDRLFEMKYPAPGSPQLAEKAKGLLDQHRIECRLISKRSFDHGIWTPLMLAFPEADIPVVQVSVQPQMNAEHHFRLGRAVESLRDENILIIGSGHITHNLHAVFDVMRGRDIDPGLEEKVSSFTNWMKIKLTNKDEASLLNWEEEAPEALFNHPSPEHLMPLYCAYGAGGENTKAALLHRSTQLGYLTSDIWRFD